MAEIDHSKGFERPKFDHRILDLTGHTFGRLTVVSFAGRNAKNLIVWNCLCSCGNECFRTSSDLRNKSIRNRRRSCGCLAVDVTRERSVSHGETNSPTYRSWHSMKDRCLRSLATGFDRYGERGITICDRWLNSFEAFRDDMGERPSLDYSIDRIDNNGNYEPGNCRWATRTEQANNRKKQKPRLLIEFNGESLTVNEWAKRIGVQPGTIHHRRWRGLPVDEVLRANGRPH